MRRDRLRVPARRLAGVAGRQNDLRRRSRRAVQAALHRPRRRRTPCCSPSRSRSWAVAINTVFGVGMSLLLVRYEFPGKRAAVGTDRPAAVGLAGRRRPRAAAGLQRRGRLVRPDPGVRRHPGDLRTARDDHGDLLRGSAARRSARSSRCSRRSATTRSRRPAASAPAPCRRSAGSPCPPSSGRSCTASCSPGSLARRVRRRQDRLRQHRPVRPRPRPLVVEQKYSDFAPGRRRTPSSFILVLISVLCILVVSLLRPKESSVMSIEIPDVNKRFGDFVALEDVNVSTAHRAADRAARPVRRRQVHAAADHRRPGEGRHRHGGHRGHRCDPDAAAEAQRRLRVPALRGVQAHDGRQERRVRPGDPQAAEGRGARTGRRAARARPPLAVRGPAPVPALGRPAPADGAGPGARRTAQGAAARRAVRCPRREGPQGAARLAAPAPRRGPGDDGVRDPRPGGGDGGRRRDRGHQRRPDRAGRHARLAVRRAGQRLRDGLPR